MCKFKTLYKLIKNPDQRFLFFANHFFYNFLSDEIFIKKKYYYLLKKKLDLKNPTLFNEKLQWLKLNDRKDLYTVISDKYEVKRWVKERIGEGYIIPTLGIWNNFNDIDFTDLPNQFVLKCTHDSGGIVICKDKDKLDYGKAKKKINSSLKKNFYYVGREWQYKNIQPRVIAEKYMEDEKVVGNEKLNKNADGLLDYKFYCFNGEAKFLYVAFANMESGVKKDLISFYDLEWKQTPFYRIDHEPLPFCLEKPEKLDEMITVANALAKEIPFVRVDLYLLKNNIYFSELTLCPGSGYTPFSPDEWERKLGDWIKI